MTKDDETRVVMDGMSCVKRREIAQQGIPVNGVQFKMFSYSDVVLIEIQRLESVVVEYFSD